ncbi:MAG: hypothetical protein RLZZ200_578 [Pseudomonadota bacterium]|jgi:hypothetical protein
MSSRITMLSGIVAVLLFVAVPRAQSAAPKPFASREEVENLLATGLPSGSSVAAVSRFLDQHGIGHGKAEPSGPSMQVTGSVPGLRSKTSRFSLQVRFSFLQDRLIGYSFTEVPAGQGQGG